MHRFFAEITDKDRAYLSSEDSAHAIKVLRLRAGDTVTVCDGSSTDYTGTIVGTDAHRVELLLSDAHPSETESDIKISLIQCLPKVGKMETIIQKCVELGVCGFYPVTSVRCVVNVDKKSSDTKTARYRKVAYEAAKQSVRGMIPEVHTIGTLADFDFSGYDLIIIPYEEERDTTVKDLYERNRDVFNKKGAKIAVIIGPEGGFERSEVDNVTAQGGVSITLGRRILRTETAGMAAVAMIMAFAEG